MKTTKAFLLKTFMFIAVLMIAVSISAYAGGTLEKIADTAKKANDTVQGVNDIINTVDNTIEGVGGAVRGVEDIGQDTKDVLGIETPPQQQPGQTQGPVVVQAQGPGQGSGFLVGTWVYESMFSPSKFYFTADSYIYYRGMEEHTRGKYLVSGNSVKLLNESGNDFATIMINGNSFEFWGSTFTKQ